MAIDKNGAEIKPGDEIIVRGTVAEVFDSIIRVEWENKTAFIDYVRADGVEKLELATAGSSE